MDFGIKDKNVFITAASKGIGFATALAFLKEGSNVAICSSNNENLAIAEKKLFENTGENVFPLKCDLNSKDDITEAVKKLNERFGYIDILVNNCGGPAPGMFKDLTEESWEHAFHQVLMSAVRFSKLLLPGMQKNKWGRIINMTSLSVKQPVDNLMLSNSLRSGLIGWAKTLSNEYGQYNITVNNIAPGYTKTERLEELAEIRAKNSGKTKEIILKEMGASVPMHRLASPNETAALIAFLASEQAGYITGTTIPVDGGAIKSLL